MFYSCMPFLTKICWPSPSNHEKTDPLGIKYASICLLSSLLVNSVIFCPNHYQLQSCHTSEHLSGHWFRADLHLRPEFQITPSWALLPNTTYHSDIQIQDKASSELAPTEIRHGLYSQKLKRNNRCVVKSQHGVIYKYPPSPWTFPHWQTGS